MSEHFSDDEIQSLRQHGIALFADRVLIAVQPPMSEARIDEIEAMCAGPLPDALRELWRLTAGGELAYDLHARMDGNEEALSWSELFYDGSDHYRDLAGWIEHEQECAEEAAGESGEAWTASCVICPSAVSNIATAFMCAWSRARRPAASWPGSRGCRAGRTRCNRMALRRSRPICVARLPSCAWRKTPRTPTARGYACWSIWTSAWRITACRRALADKLTAFYRRALVDWRGPLAAGTLGRSPRLANLAMRHALANDDGALVGQLAAQGMRLDQPLRGSATALDVALMRHAHAAAQALLRADAPVSADALHRFDRQPPAELVAQLLARGARADGLGAARCVACGAPDAARLIVAAGGEGMGAAYAEARDAMLTRYEEDLRRVRAGKLGHYLGADGLAERIANLRAFSI
ncbi:SMI1/KNR4 family protein [Achromobacter xylosoxidans]